MNSIGKPTRGKKRALREQRKEAVKEPKLFIDYFEFPLCNRFSYEIILNFRLRFRSLSGLMEPKLTVKIWCKKKSLPFLS